MISSGKTRELEPVEAMKHRIRREGSNPMIHELLYGDVFGLVELVLLGKMKTRKSLK